MDEIEEEFNEAADFVASNGPTSAVGDKVLLRLYGLYKVATIGACRDQQPSIFNLKARSKWSAWNELSLTNLSKEEAMRKYVQVVKESMGWESKFANNDDNNSGSASSHGSGSGGLLGPGVSSFAIPCADDEDGEEDSNPVFAWAKDCDVQKLSDWVKTKPSEINTTDSNGLTPLHWAVDRGHVEACKVLLAAGADPNHPDNDGSTPFQYAETCEHDEIIILLQQSIK